VGHWSDEYTAEDVAAMLEESRITDADLEDAARDPRRDDVPDLSTFTPCTCEYSEGSWEVCMRHRTPHSAHQPWDAAPGCRFCTAEGFTFLEDR